jgi:chromate transporter
VPFLHQGVVQQFGGIFLPVYFFTVVPAPWFSRNRDNAQLKAFVQGATAAATGAERLTSDVVTTSDRSALALPPTPPYPSE